MLHVERWLVDRRAIVDVICEDNEDCGKGAAIEERVAPGIK